jgi:hypothetical protein
MSRFRVVLGGISAAFAVFAAFAVLLLVAPAASADPVDDATSTLQNSSLYVAPGAEGRVDNRSAVQNAFGSSVKAAIFPSTVNGPDAVNRLHAAISPQQTLVVFDGNRYQAKSGVYCQGFAQTQMDKAYSDTRANLQATNGDLTNTLVEFANNLKGGPVCANGSGTGSTDTASGESGGGAAVWPWLVGLGVLRGGPRRSRVLPQAQAQEAVGGGQGERDALLRPPRERSQHLGSQGQCDGAAGRRGRVRAIQLRRLATGHSRLGREVRGCATHHLWRACTRR